MKRILIADDHSIVRLGVSVLLNNELKNIHIDYATTIDEVFCHLKKNSFDLILLDINMPGGNNIKVIKEILQIQSTTKILVFSSYDESVYALRYIEAGAAGYLNKNTDMEDLKYAITSIFEKGKYMSPAVKNLYIQKLTSSRASLTKTNPLNNLSNREMDVAKHLIEGHGILDVSNKLNLSSSTVSTYKSRIFEKLNVKNIPELIKLFQLNTEENITDN